jgi:hypothetical protein
VSIEDDRFRRRHIERIPVPFAVTSGSAIGPLFTRPGRRVLMFWAVLAVVNIGAGVFISTQPHRITDLETMMRWGRSWLMSGDPLYGSPGALVDYPPYAIVLLSPIGMLPIGLAVPIWVTLNIGFACMAPYLAARFFRPHDSFKGVLLPILMFLTWGGVRTLTQFSLMALALSMAALYLADLRPREAGVWLGLGLMKPQVAVPVFLWSVFTRRWRVVLTSAVVVLVLIAMFCLRAQVSPNAILTSYTGILATAFTGDAILVGLSELRPLLQGFVTDAGDLDLMTVSIVLALLAAICMAGLQEGAHRSRVLYAAPPLVACWSLLSIYHLTYGFIVLLPVMMLLAFNDAEASRLRKTLFWLLQIGMMVDVPGLSRRLGLSGTALYDTVLVHADRVLILGLFIGLAVLAWREAPEDRASAHGL